MNTNKYKNIRKKAVIFLAAALALVTALCSCERQKGKTAVETTSPLPECDLLRTEKSGDFTYAIYEEYVEITGYSGNAASVSVPSEYSGGKVLSIGKAAFQGNKLIESVTLPESVLNIEAAAFKNCEKLSSAAIPGVKSIGASAFFNTALREIELPEVLENLGRQSFSNTKLEFAELPGGIVRSGDYVFSGCTELKSVSFADGFSEISVRMFSGCTALESVSVPDSVSAVGGYAFTFCTGLKTVTLGGKTDIGDGAFHGCDSLTIRSAAGSPAEKYASLYGIPFEVAK